MLSDTSSLAGNTELMLPQNVVVRRDSSREYAKGVGQFFAVLIQFALIVLPINSWQLESLSLGRVMELAFVGNTPWSIHRSPVLGPFWSGRQRS
jgi:hypothetical protein